MYVMVSEEISESIKNKLSLVDKEDVETPLGKLTIIYNKFLPKEFIMLNDGNGGMELFRWNGIDYVSVGRTNIGGKGFLW